MHYSYCQALMSIDQVLTCDYCKQHHEESPTYDGYHSSELSEVHGLLHLGISFVEESYHQQVSVSVEHDKVTCLFSFPRKVHMFGWQEPMRDWKPRCHPSMLSVLGSSCSVRWLTFHMSWLNFGSRLWRLPGLPTYVFKVVHQALVIITTVFRKGLKCINYICYWTKSNGR